MITSNYAGRSVDLLIFQGTAPVGEQAIYLGFGAGGELTTGVQKMAQTFAILFLTEKGSIPCQPDLGTDFVGSVRMGSMRDTADVRANFNLAVTALKRTMAIEATNADLPDDETLASAELLDVDIDRTRGKLSLSVRLLSLAGTSHDIFLPVPFAIQ